MAYIWIATFIGASHQICGSVRGATSERENAQSAKDRPLQAPSSRCSQLRLIWASSESLSLGLDCRHFKKRAWSSPRQFLPSTATRISLVYPSGINGSDCQLERLLHAEIKVTWLTVVYKFTALKNMGKCSPCRLEPSGLYPPHITWVQPPSICITASRDRSPIVIKVTMGHLLVVFLSRRPFRALLVKITIVGIIFQAFSGSFDKKVSWADH